MSIATEINKLRDRQESIIQQINNKGVSLPSGSSLAACATAISQIQTGGGGTSFTGHVDRVGLAAIGWTEDDIDFYQAHGVNWNEEQDNFHLVSAENIALYTNATKVTVGGIEMADGSYFDTFKDDVHCRFFPKTDTSSKTSLSFSESRWINAIPKLFAAPDNMRYMFQGCHSLTSVDLSGFDTSNVINMSYMFGGCHSLTSVDLSGFDTSNVINMSGMLEGCNSLIYVDLSCFDTSKVTNMGYMFNSCNSLIYVDLSCFDTSKVTNMSSIFSNINSLANVKFGERFNQNAISSASNALFGSSSVGVPVLASNDFETVKGVLSVFARTTSSLHFNVYFYSGTTIKDDSDGTLAALKAACEAKGFTISNLTIEAAA